MVLNLKPTVAHETTFSGEPVPVQKKQALQVAREFYCHPERATSATGEFNADMVANIAMGFLDWYGDEITGEAICGTAWNAVSDAAKIAFEIFQTDRDAIATAVAFTTFALIPPTQR